MKTQIIPILIWMVLATPGVALDEEQILDWDALQSFPQHPEWLLDAKFGIYTHWGPATLANSKTAGGDGHGQYAMFMYNDVGRSKERKETNFQYHKRSWGDQKEFGYKDFLPLFTGENFDAEEWAAVFKQAGAKFAGPVASHHDGFLMWDSEVSRWNSGKTGPKRDISGELAKAIRAQGMTFIGTFHHSRTWSYMENSHAYDGLTPGYEDLYWPHERKAKHSKEFLDWWYGSLREYIDKYEPRMIWFDFALKGIDDTYKRKFLTYYYEKAREWDQGVVVTWKGTCLPEGIGMLDYERMRQSTLPGFNWLTDGSTGPWFYFNDTKSRSSLQLVHELIDIVSKQGCLLLNVPPKPDGTLPDDAKEALRGLGQWLAVNGEAIYETRAWATFGEGPTSKLGGDIIEKVKRGKPLTEKEQRMLDTDDHRIHLVKGQRYDARDIRFTRSKDGKTVYAMVMGMPEGGKVTVESMRTNSGLHPVEIHSVELLGSDAHLEWKLSDRGLEISLPENLPNDYALTFQIR